MKIGTKQALSYFHPSSSYEQVYFEAVANALDAGATEVSIRIEIAAFGKPETLKLTISDNGEGFTEENFRKFSNLLLVDAPDHKGLGRLVFLAYFGKVDIVSFFGGAKERRIRFDMEFEDDSKVRDVEPCESGSTLVFSGFLGKRIKTYDYLRPEYIREQLLSHFLPLLFSRKQTKRGLRIDIELVAEKASSEHDFYPGKTSIRLEDLPELSRTTIQNDFLDWFHEIEVHYSIDHEKTRPKSMEVAVSVDGRAMPYQLVSQESIPAGYQALFLLKSDLFRVDSARQQLQLAPSVNEDELKRTVRAGINRIVSNEIPAVKQENKKTCTELATKYPHLGGYFSADTVGLVSKDAAIASAQEQFFADQKAVLECEELDDATYEKALHVSARLLTEYILYRARIIQKLKSTDLESDEADIHSLIVPKGMTARRETASESIFACNVWLLDDKYMELAVGGDEEDGRPDITIIFSADPDAEKPAKVDVVVVELKKHGVKLAKEEEVVSQLRQRARRLLKFYPDRINRIWFYGITDIQPEFRRTLLEDQFKELFSHGQVFYKSQPIIVDNEDEKFPVDLYVMNYDALIQDAESRNSTFLNLLKESMARVAEAEAPPKATSKQEPQATETCE
jgi:hypothetical protein